VADLKTFFTEPAMTAPGLEGDTVTQRGSDPQIDGGSGANGLQDFWEAGQVIEGENVGMEETSNPVSGLPLRPARWEPAASSEQPPDLTDRNPGTIDRR
jgi:hypothetical protein